MKQLLVINENNINPGATASPDKYQIRKAARAIVRNQNNEIAILAVTTENYHKLPGGGVENGEDMLMALERVPRRNWLSSSC